MHRLPFACVLACSIVVPVLGSGCSAVINPDLSQLDPDASATRDGAVPGFDSGVPNDAYVAPGTDTGPIPGNDAWVAPGDDGGVVNPNDAWVAPAPDAWVRPDAWSAPACTGVECSGWAAAIAAAPRGASGNTPGEALANCVIQMHQSDCCGARRAYGVNHAARGGSTGTGGLCAAEATCDAMYATPRPCMSDVITTDTGQMTTNPNDVRIRAVRPMACAFGTCYTCETFVCTSDPCRTAPGISGGCGGTGP